MPIVMKLGESPKDPKKKPDAKAAKTAAAAKPKAKGAGSDEGLGDKQKFIIAGVVLVLAIGFIAWYFMGSGEPATKDQSSTSSGGAAAGGVRKSSGDAAGGGKRGAGLNLDEDGGGSASGKSKKVPGDGIE